MPTPPPHPFPYVVAAIRTYCSTAPFHLHDTAGAFLLPHRLRPFPSITRFSLTNPACPPLPCADYITLPVGERSQRGSPSGPISAIRRQGKRAGTAPH